jgi:hypothetical protein
MVPEFLTIAMTVKVAEGVALQLNPDLELSKVAIPVPTVHLIVEYIVRSYYSFYLDCGESSSGVSYEENKRKIHVIRALPGLVCCALLRE